MRRPVSLLPWLLLAVLGAARAADPPTHATAAPATTADNAAVVANATGEILKAAETADPKKVEIVKQIRRLNDDGSYTVGYEAGDGTFKIESRDVLGNVKGTFGYIDEDGEIKRVTYSSSNSSTPTPVLVGSSSAATSTPPPPPTAPPPTRGVSSTTRRPLPTVVYPRAGAPPARGTVIQPIPRKRPITVDSSRSELGDASVTTTDTKDGTAETTTSNISNLYKPKLDESFMKPMKMMMRPMADSTTKEVLQAKQTSTEASARTLHTVKPVYEHITEKEAPMPRANQFRRQLPGASGNPHMLSLQQSVGDDSTDVYGGHQSLGTVRPLFTTTTPRTRLVPFSSILAARQKLQEHVLRASEAAHETTIEASTGRVFDRENVVTSNPVPQHRDRLDERFYQQPLYRRQYPTAQFRTTEYLRDNPGAPIPIGNQRAFLNYDFRSQQVEPPQFYRESTPQPPPAQPAPLEAATPTPYTLRPVTRIIPIAVDERGVPIPGYKFAVNPFDAPTAPPPAPARSYPLEPVPDDMQAITTPVSTRDLKRLLQILLVRQGRLQALMDDITSPGPPYRPLPLYRAEPQYEPRPQPALYQNYAQRPAPAQQEPLRHQYDDYRASFGRASSYDERARLGGAQQQRELYTNQISGYEVTPQYESQRFVPRRRLYTRPQYEQYDTEPANSNHVGDGGGGGGDYLPADVREALLLKMLMLAISPEYMPRPLALAAGLVSPPVRADAVAPTELTTAAPLYRKQVRNVQILGEEGSKDEAKRRAQAMERH